MVPIPAQTDEDDNQYVPNALDGQLTLTNAQFLNDYNDQNSSAFKSMAAELQEGLRKALQTPGKNDEEFFVKILSLKPGSIVVDYRISWPQKTNSDNEQLTEYTMKERLNNYLASNFNYMNSYIVPLTTIRVAKLPDLCKMHPDDFE
jgi:SEA domain